MAALLSIGLSPLMRPPAPARASDLSLTRYVNPFIGTSPDAPDYGINNAAGDTFPGAVTPNGMAQFSPTPPPTLGAIATTKIRSTPSA